jgi:L-malate glycosyltransferase
MQHPQRILFIQTQGENAGAQEISRLVGAGLSARGHDVRHLFFYRKSESFDAPPNTRYCAIERPRGIAAALQFPWRLMREIRAARPDVIFTFQHYGNTVGGLVARLVSAAPVVANQVSARLLMNPPVRLADLALGVLGAFNLITVNSAGMLQDYSCHPTSYSRRLRHIPHGFDQKTTSFTKAEARAVFGLPAGVALLGSVARLNPMKRLDAAIRLLRDRPTWHLAIAGQGPQERALRQLASEIGACERVSFIGDVPPERIGDFLASLDVFVFPTCAETFGLAAVEAASAGIPVVASDLAVLREVLHVNGRAAALFVDAADDRLLANAVSRALTDPWLRNDLIANGRGLRARYSVARMVDGYEQILADLHSSAAELVAAA